MRMRCINDRGLATATFRKSSFWGTILIPLLLLSFSQDGITQETTAPVQARKSADSPDIPYLAEKTIAERLKEAPLGFISNVSTSREAGQLVVSIEASCQPAFQEFSLGNPPRLVVDFLNMENRAPVLNQAVGAGGVKQFRIRQFQSSDPKITRLVFDLEQSYGNHEVANGNKGVLITFRPDQRASADAPRETESHPTAETKVSAPARRAEPQQERESQEIRPPVTAPVISDLSVSEIPQSALASAAAAPAVRVQPPAPRQPATAPPPAAPPASLTPVLSLPAQPGEFAGHPLTLDLVNISLVDFFRLMAEEGGINVVMDPGIQGTLSIKVVKVPWDQIFEAALTNNSLEKQIDGNLVRIATKKTIQAEAKQREELKKASLLAADVETRVRRLNYAKAAVLLPVLKDQITVRGTITVDERTGSLVITDIPGSVDKMQQLINDLDTPEPQVEIEARIVSATRDFARDIGVQFGFVQGNLERVTVGGPNTFGTIGGTRPTATPKNTYAAGNPTTGRGASEGQTTESGGVSTGAKSSDNPGNFNVNLPSLLPFGGLGLSVGNILDTFLLDAAITAGESKGQAKLISQPKLTTQNNNPGTITQGLRFPVQVIANNTVTVQFENAALTLTVTPQITSEGNVVLDLKVENNTPDFANAVMGIPSIRTSESTTRVLVSDGGTTVIGGILVDSEQTQEDRVPGLASLPIFGNLFKRNMVSHDTQEVLFFVTPRIVK